MGRSSKSLSLSRLRVGSKRNIKKSNFPARASGLTAVALAVGLSCQGSQAATLFVNNSTDALLADTIGGNCTLREALSAILVGSTAVNGAETGCESFGPAFGTNDRIEFAAGIDGQTIPLSFGPGGISLGQSVEFNRNDRDITVDMSGNSRGFTIFNAGTEVILNSLTLTGGNSPDGDNGYGSSILAFDGSTVTITNSNITGNNAGATSAVLVSGVGTELIMENTTISSNSARLTGPGTNFGGGVLIFNGSAATIVDSTISNNNGGFGAGVSAGGAGAILIRNTTISNNTAEVVGTTPNGSGQGGGLGLSGSPSVTIENSTISGNVANFGSVISSFGSSATLQNSTMSGNVANVVAGLGVYDGSNIAFVSSTFAFNEVPGDAASGGIVVRDGTTVSFENSILAGSSFSDCFVSPTGSFSSDSNSIIQNPNVGEASCASSARVGINPVLGVLRNNGGPTMTHALAASSPAIGTGGSCLATDQRGRTRPRTGCDVGAFQVPLPPPPPPPPPPPGAIIPPALLLLLLDE